MKKSAIEDGDVPERRALLQSQCEAQVKYINALEELTKQDDAEGIKPEKFRYYQSLISLRNSSWRKAGDGGWYLKSYHGLLSPSW